jgi:LruC domain-containing protein
MNLQKIFILIFILAVTFAGCRKINNDNPKPSDNLTMNDLVIPEDFNWETYSDIKLNIGVQTSQPMTFISKVSVFNGNPSEGGKLLLSGGASPKENFQASLRVPANLKEVYLMVEFPFGITKVEKVAVSEQISFTFDDFFDNGNLKSSSNFKATTDVGPACDDCDVYMTGSGSYNIGNGQKYCVAENETFTGSVTFQGWNGGGTLQICGTANMASIILGNNAHLVVTQNGSLTLGSFSSNSSPNSVIIYENASVTINNNIQTQGTSFENQGLLYINGNLTAQQLTNGFTNSGSLNITGIFTQGDITFNNFGSISHVGSAFNSNSGNFTNTGIMVIHGVFQIQNTFTNDGSISHTGTAININFSNANLLNNGYIFLNRLAGANLNLNNGTVTNNNLIDVIGNINHNSAVDLINNCSMICTGEFDVNNGGTVQNYSGYIRANLLDLNTNAALLLNDKSMISVTTLTRNNNATITGSGGLNTVLVSGNTTFNNNGPTISGAIEFATDNINLAPAAIPSHFVNGATLVGIDFVTNSIIAGPCNPEGIGPQIVDTDGDGVADDLDDFPDDEYRAFNYQFPEPGSHITIMFEDLWPGKGDYDFNDLVISVSGSEVANADNDIVETYINLDVKAVGASLENGFGWQYANIPPSAIEQVSGFVLGTNSNIVLNSNGTEAGQDSAVIIAIENFEDVINRAGGSMYNTVDNGNAGVSDVVTVHVLFGETNPLPRELFSNGDIYNIFLIKNQQRGTEIHLPDREPTDLMTYPFGEFQDTSDPLTGRYYKTASGLPWAMIIYDQFAWPLETIPIIEAYPDFASWAQSGGTNDTLWYANPVPSKVWNE